MNIVFATSEMAPFAKTGGLADVCGSLPAALANNGMTVKVFLPMYKGIDKTEYILTDVLDSVAVPIGDETYVGSVYAYDDYHENVQVLFVDHKGFFCRDELYGDEKGDYPDNDKRFIFFQRVVLETLRLIDFKPDVVHCHDWQTGLIPAYIKSPVYDGDFYQDTQTVFTIHNLAYQGLFGEETFLRTGLPQSVYSAEGVEFYGKCNFMKGGIRYADTVTTVSKRYAQEIQLPDCGYGLEGMLGDRGDTLVGIVNGVDTDDWNSATDKDITVNFTAGELDKKYINKGVLQKENGLPVDRDVPLFGMVCRLVDQKGLDILDEIIPEIAKLDMQLVVLGTGDPRYHVNLKRYALEYPKKFGINILFDAQMAKRIYAGSDVFLMPSLFEPCGLGQLIAYRFASVPLVRQTGGLADTVTDFNKVSGEGSGFVFSEYSSAALLSAITKAVEYYKDKKMWKSIIQNGANLDFSWTRSAETYIELYEKAQKKKLVNA